VLNQSNTTKSSKSAKPSQANETCLYQQLSERHAKAARIADTAGFSDCEARQLCAIALAFTKAKIRDQSSKSAKPSQSNETCLYQQLSKLQRR